MAHKVGTKGQVVIAKEIRDKLGIEPGALTIQRIVDGHLEIRFVPVTHHSVAGILAGRGEPIGPDDDWQVVKERAWAEAARERVEGWKADE
jgi:AbrB family looped-hinge helix DNA binding protein